MSGKLSDYLADINYEAEEMISRLTKQMAEQQGITEQFKANNQMAWVQRMNNIRCSAIEIINSNLILITKRGMVKWHHTTLLLIIVLKSLSFKLTFCH